MAWAEAGAEASAAQEYFQSALKVLEGHRSVQARLIEQVNISDQPIRLTGRYISMASRLRLELSVKLSGDVEGSLLEVSDGDNLWSQSFIADIRHVKLKNLKQISSVLGKQANTPTPQWEMELGLGGVAGLMNSLQRTMTFEHRREETQGGVSYVVIQGKWNPEFTQQWQQSPDQPLPSYVPDLLRIYFNTENQFPTRFLYLKRNPEKQSYRPLVRLEFLDLKLNGEVNEAEFKYAPPPDLVPEDITQQYIDLRLKQQAPATPPVTPPPAQSPPTQAPPAQ